MLTITTPTGKIGSKVVRQLVDQDIDFRVIARDPSHLPEDVRTKADVVVGSHGDPETINKALDGTDTLLWITAGDRAKATTPYQMYLPFVLPAADAIVKNHVSRVVAVSVVGRGVQRYAGMDSAQIAANDVLRSTGVDFRELALPSFMENLIAQAPALKNDGVLTSFMPADLAVPTVAARDIASAATRFLLDDTWTGQETVGVLGAADISYNKMADVLSDVLGKQVRYQQVPHEVFKQMYIKGGLAEPLAQGMVDMNKAKAEGIDLAIKRDETNTTPTSFRQWATDTLKPIVEQA